MRQREQARGAEEAVRRGGGLAGKSCLWRGGVADCNTGRFRGASGSSISLTWAVLSLRPEGCFFFGLFFRFHIYVLAYGICFSLSDLLHSV